MTLRAHLSDGPSADDVLRAKCTQVEVERDVYLSRLRESDGQLVAARREESDMEASLCNSAREKAMYILKSEHAIMLKTREDELITDMRKQFCENAMLT